MRSEGFEQCLANLQLLKESIRPFSGSNKLLKNLIILYPEGVCFEMIINSNRNISAVIPSE
ncbi:MAG: hypothetical protein ACI9VN_003337 [Patescibacteria group bacterium]|jgi:hypothetical protein